MHVQLVKIILTFVTKLYRMSLPHKMFVQYSRNVYKVHNKYYGGIKWERKFYAHLLV